jgi:hypothetical protein
MDHMRRMRFLVISALVWLAVCNFRGWGDPNIIVLVQSLLGAGNIAITHVEKQIDHKDRG